LDLCKTESAFDETDLSVDAECLRIQLTMISSEGVSRVDKSEMNLRLAEMEKMAAMRPAIIFELRYKLGKYLVSDIKIGRRQSKPSPSGC